MSRRVLPFGGPCHDGEEWTCQQCRRIQCHRCDGIPSPDFLCWQCINDRDQEGGDAA